MNQLQQHLDRNIMSDGNYALKPHVLAIMPGVVVTGSMGKFKATKDGVVIAAAHGSRACWQEVAERIIKGAI